LLLLLDKQFLETPFYGVQQITWHLQNDGYRVNVKRTRRLMRLMPIYQKPAGEGPQNYAYLLRGARVDCPNQVCALYLPMKRGFLYLVAIMDWFTRKVLAWRHAVEGSGNIGCDRQKNLGNSRVALRLIDLDFARDLERQADTFDLQRHPGRKPLVRLEPAQRGGVPDRLLDLALRRDSDLLKKLANADIQCIFVHRCLLAFARRSACCGSV
jgi:hypothetical protein